MNISSDTYNKLLISAHKIAPTSDDAYELLHFTLTYLEIKNDIVFTFPDLQQFSYINRAMYMGWNFPSSPFYRQYRNQQISYVEHIDDVDDAGMTDVLNIELLDIAISRLPEHEQYIINAYLQGDFDYEYWSTIAGCSVDYLYTYINKIKSKIKSYVVRCKTNSR
jgi:hypothetical protein